MCAIVGALIKPISDAGTMNKVNAFLEEIWQLSHERGRDGRGYSVVNGTHGNRTAIHHHRDVDRKLHDNHPPAVVVANVFTSMVGNLRAEPTTEFVSEKKHSDQQPYVRGGWAIAHNGTIANDKELRTYYVPTQIDSAAIVEELHLCGGNFLAFQAGIRRLKGSFAILAQRVNDPEVLYAAVNYRPLWYAVHETGVYFASARQYFPGELVPQMLHPYSASQFDVYGPKHDVSLYPIEQQSKRALVVCSGGLDSVVAATYAKKSMGYDIHLLHFMYGSRAEGPEVAAIKAVADWLECPLTLFPLPVYAKGDSPLLDPDSLVAGGEAGAEFAYEWVPARNLVLLSVATAFAEARGISTIVLGNNLEEAGAYPDNEPEFIERFNDLLPFAVGDGKRMNVIMPVGNLMKHEIVRLGHSIQAPMHLTWSCYRAGQVHCGACGPCFMRRRAHEINGLKDSIEYASS